MPKQVVETLYTFRELIDLEKEDKSWSRAVDTARIWLQDVATDIEWWDCVYEEWGKALQQIGFEDAEMEFSGFWSQGDGASFTSSVDIPKLIDFMSNPPVPKPSIDHSNKKPEGEDFVPWLVHKLDGWKGNPEYRKLRGLRTIEAAVKRTCHRYSHEQTCSFEADFPNDRHPNWKIFEAWRTAAEELRRALCHALYEYLEKEYEGLTDDDALLERADDSDWWFDSGGTFTE